MITRGLAVAAAIFLIVGAADAAGDGDLSSAILRCAAQQDETAQLTCYNQIAARLKSGAAPAAQAPEAPPARRVIGSVADFGLESVPFDTTGPVKRAQITAKVAHVSYNFFHIFTVTLDNGQVWRQADSDSSIAQFKTDKPEVVTISRGFLDSFHLAIQGRWGSYAVKRIK
jgi:hypothetical protein